MNKNNLTNEKVLLNIIKMDDIKFLKKILNSDINMQCSILKPKMETYPFYKAYELKKLDVLEILTSFLDFRFEIKERVFLNNFSKTLYKKEDFNAFDAQVANLLIKRCKENNIIETPYSSFAQLQSKVNNFNLKENKKPKF